PIGAELKLPSPDEIARQPVVETKVERPLEPLSPRPAPQPPAGVKRTYRVKAGDTLAAIAKQFYGDGERYQEIYEANRQRLQVPDDLREGLLLDIP
ncbi:MAG TPA: LysM peptidoglycan-binding domain-containing protein, partial [Pirellulales bacterium]|nr:LysM peptidoglycan-binding domain-containing protein [Pirellulales bacterium]